jgi:hypothetical protein
MTAEIDRLKAELNDMNVKCQLARDNEVRFALQRGRLEAERTQLLVKMIEAMAPTADPVAALPPSLSPGPYRVTMAPSTDRSCPMLRQAAAAVPATPRLPPLRARPARKKRSVKPVGIPTTAQMTLTVLQEAGSWLQTKQITEAIRNRWWPQATSRDIGPGAWRMAQTGQLERSEQHGYRLPVVRPVGGHVIGNGATA